MGKFWLDSLRGVVTESAIKLPTLHYGRQRQFYVECLKKSVLKFDMGET